MDVASSVVAERIIAALAARTWSLGHETDEACHAILLTRGDGALSRPGEDDIELESPALLWLPPRLRAQFTLRAGGEGFRLFADVKFVQRTASDPILAGGSRASLGRMLLIGAEPLSNRLPSLAASFEALALESRELQDGAAAAIGLHLGLIILALWRGTGLRGAQDRSGRATIDRFMQLIELHYREHLRIRDYADRLGVSQAHLHDTCLRVRGRTPLALVHERLLEEARARLQRSECSVEQIGYNLGFSDPGYFNRFFKRLTGQSPGAFQRSTSARATPVPPSFAAWP